MTNLFSLVGQYRELQNLDLEEIDEQTFLNTLEGLGGEIEVKATNVALYHKNVQAFADAIQGAAKTLSARGNVVQKKADSIKAYLKSCMEAAQITKIESPEVSIKIKKNPPALKIHNSDITPDEFMVTIPESRQPNHAAIKEALKAHYIIPGYSLEQATRLDIK